jgi:hypothetical protein
MNPTTPPRRHYLAARVHAALLKAGRPVTRGELVGMFLSPIPKVADVQAALDALTAEGLAEKSEERERWQRFDVWRAVSVGED